MSATFNLNEKTAHVEAPKEKGESSGTVQRGPDDQKERPKSPCINMDPSLSNTEGEQPAAMPATGQQSERIENLVNLFREFLETVPNKVVSGSSHPDTQRNMAGRKRFFGLAKGFSSETGSNNKYDYEQKYSRDEPGKEVAENARIWLTYLDEAESFDHERAERWKDTVDVLLVFVRRTFIPNVVQSQLKEVEYQSYLRIEATGLHDKVEPQTLRGAIMGDLSLPLTMWCHLFKETSPDPTEAVHILTRGPWGLFNWKFNPTHHCLWKFERLFCYFKLGNPDYSSEAKCYETCYLLLITIYRNLTSDYPLITHEVRRRNSLLYVFASFSWYFDPSKRLHTLENAEYCFTFFKHIFCVDSFWCESMTDDTRLRVTNSLHYIYFWMNTPLDNHLTFADGHDLSLIYQWYSRDLDPGLLYRTPPLFVLLLVPRNHHHLSTILLEDPDAVSNFSRCLYNLANYVYISKELRTYEVLVDLLKSVNPKNPLFTILYSPSVLQQLWKLLVFFDSDTKWYFQLIKSRIERGKLDEYLHPEEVAHNACSALKTSVREFGELVAENSASDKVDDTEERAHPTDYIIPHSIAHWTKKVLEFIRPRTSVKSTDQSRDV